tara:strand:- start:3791 stop:5116 length:1326 start_codon:yes stop_codon:yes gene_type:complete
MINTKHPSIISKSYLLKLSIPIFFSNLVIPLVGFVDTVLMGHEESTKFLAATSIATSVITMIFWSFGFLRMSTVGLVSQSMGKGDYREISLITIRGISLAIIIGFIIIFLKNPIILLIKSYFEISIETYKLIEKYISIRILSAPAELVIYVLVGLFLGLQKTKISSLIVIFFSILNIFLSIYFVNELKLNIYGVAMGTLISAYFSSFIFLIFTYYFIKKEFSVIPRFKKIFLKKKIFNLFKINFNIFIRTILLTFAFLWFTYQSSLISEDILAANTVLIQFILLASFFLDAYAFSTEGVIGFSLGRKVKKSFLLAVKNSIELSFFTGLLISLIFLIFFKPIVNLITDLDYLRFLTYGFVIWVIIIPPVASFCYQYDGIYIGASQTTEMRNSMIISVIIYILITMILVKEFGNNGLWASLTIFMILRYLTLKIFFPNILKKF